VAVIAELREEPYWPEEDGWLKWVRWSFGIISIVCLVLLVFVILSSRYLHDMFHTLRANTGVFLLIGLIAFMVASDRDLCFDNLNANVFVASLHQLGFGVASCSICAETFATFRAITGGIIGGKTSSYMLLAHGFPLINTGLSMYMYGGDYGTDPR